MLRLRAARARLTDESGVVLVVVSGFILVLGIFSATLLASASSSKNQTYETRIAKQALGASLAGLRTAIYRLNVSTPADAACPPLPDGTAAPVNSDGVCGPYESGAPSASPGAGQQPLRRSQFRYWITRTMGTGTPDVCTGSAPSSALRPHLTFQQRCITSVGEQLSVDGAHVIATRRVQARVAATDPEFPIPGIWGTLCVTIGSAVVNQGLNRCENANPGAGSAVYQGSVGSNGTLTPNNSAFGLNMSTGNWQYDPSTASIDPPRPPANLYLGWQHPGLPTEARYELRLGGSAEGTGQACNNSSNVFTNTNDCLPYHDRGNRPIRFNRYFSLPRMGTRFANPAPPVRDSSIACTQANCDVAVFNHNLNLVPIAAGGTGTATIAPKPGSGATCTTTGYIHSSRTLDVPESCILSLPNGTYDFCRIIVNSNASVRPQITTLEGGEVRVFLDSAPSVRPGSGCPTSGSGVFELRGSGSNTATYMTAAGANDACSAATTVDTWDSLASQLYVFGAGDPTATRLAEPEPRTPYWTAPPNHVIDIPSGAKMNALMQAPNSIVNLNNPGSCIRGGLAAAIVNVATNAGFFWDSKADILLARNTNRTYYRTAFSNCNNSNTAANAANPLDGC